MKLSIIIPCYKVEEYLDQCLESVTRNKTEEIEIILVDDGSPDRVPQMCDEWAEKDSRIKVIHQENGGLSVARNTGIENSCGEYIWFIDSDDWIKEDAIDRIMHLINNYPEIDIFVFPLLWTYEGKGKDWMDINIKENKQVTGKEYLKIGRNTIGASPRNIIKLTVLQSANIRFYPGIIHEDGLFGNLIYNQANKVMVISSYVYFYRQRSGSIMHTISMKSSYSMITIHKELIKYMEQYVPIHERPSFRFYYLKYFVKALTFTWGYRHNPEYQKFLSDIAEYRIEQCKKCAKDGNITAKIHSFILARNPIAYVYFVSWRRMLLSQIKSRVKNSVKLVKRL